MCFVDLYVSLYYRLVTPISNGLLSASSIYNTPMCVGTHSFVLLLIT
jgi:hypothetical protein